MPSRQYLYAVALCPDFNENMKLDKGGFDFKKEPNGLSNIYWPRFSAPTFDDCKFKVTEQIWPSKQQNHTRFQHDDKKRYHID